MRTSTFPIELLAPAGSFESLQAAIQGGANAIYFGVEQLNMRARSTNSFVLSDLAEISRRCRHAGVSAYLTLNTVMYDHDLQLLRSILQEAKKQGIQAVIASDFAVMDLCRRFGMPLHVSTQANVSNVEAVQFFSRYADVVVLARELTLQQVAFITREINRRNIKGPSGNLVRIEAFVHGALCMAVSGKCYLSLHQQNASANRGACTQPCRRSYTVTDNDSGEQLLIDNEYIISPKDLCTIDLLDQVISAGISVLKIEGRGKSADYVYTTTVCYREALDAITEGTFTPAKAAAWKQRLETVYNRGFWEGYYLGRKLGEWTPHPGSAATEKKIYIGKNTRYYPRLGVAEFLVETGTLKTGDQVLLIGNRTGVWRQVLNEMRVNGQPGSVAQPGDQITIPLSLDPGIGDKLYKLLKSDG